MKVDAKLIEKQIERTQKLKENRNQKKANDAIARIRKATADSKQNIFQAVIEAIRNDVTNGEIIRELRDIYGFGRPLAI